MKFDVKGCIRELEELKIQKHKLAYIIDTPPSILSTWLAGTNQPKDDKIRDIWGVFTMVRKRHLATGGFALNQKNMDLLRKKLAEMRRSIVQRPKAVEPVESGEREANQKCQAAN
jgi:hypothetical protein